MYTYHTQMGLYPCTYFCVQFKLYLDKQTLGLCSWWYKSKCKHDLQVIRILFLCKNLLLMDDISRMFIKARNLQKGNQSPTIQIFFSLRIQCQQNSWKYRTDYAFFVVHLFNSILYCVQDNLFWASDFLFSEHNEFFIQVHRYTRHGC